MATSSNRAAAARDRSPCLVKPQRHQQRAPNRASRAATARKRHLAADPPPADSRACCSFAGLWVGAAVWGAVAQGRGAGRKVRRDTQSAAERWGGSSSGIVGGHKAWECAQMVAGAAGGRSWAGVHVIPPSMHLLSKGNTISRADPRMVCPRNRSVCVHTQTTDQRAGGEEQDSERRR